MSRSDQLKEEPPLDPQFEIPRLRRTLTAVSAWLVVGWILAVVGLIGAGLAFRQARQSADDAAAAMVVANSAKTENGKLVAQIAAKDTAVVGLQVRLSTAEQRLVALAGSVRGVEDDMADIAATIDAEEYATKADVAAVQAASTAEVGLVRTAVNDSLATFRTALLDEFHVFQGQQYVGVDALRTELRVEMNRQRNRQLLWNWGGLVSHIVAHWRRLK